MRLWLASAALATIAVALGAMLAFVVWDARQQAAARQVHFPISCGATSQRSFDEALARLHAMAYAEAESSFRGIAEGAPDCAIAYWGVAMSRLKRPIAVVPLLDDLRVAGAALQEAVAARIATPREQRYLAAARSLVGDGDPAGWFDRVVLYEQAMADLAAAQPDDSEATIFYALALNMAALPSDKSFRKQAKAAELLLVSLSQQPNHPGLAHYLTYCLSVPAATASSIASALPSRRASSIETALAILALAGVAAFFFSVLPVWSGASAPTRRPQ